MSSDVSIALPKIRLDLISKYNVPGPRYTSYPTAIQFSDQVPFADLLADADHDFSSGADLSVYVHLPFCESLCWYCACNTVITSQHGQAGQYLDYLAKEISLWQRHFPQRLRLGQLHFGGGTPTFLRPEEIDRLSDILHDAFDFAPDAEVSVEIDPRRLTAAHVQAFRRLGANRASLGVQDFDPHAQKSIHRIQTYEMTADAMHWARECGYNSINFDLIYGLPHQTEETFHRTLQQVKELSPDRLAVFSYAHVPWMRPAQRIFDKEGSLPTPERKLNLLKLIIQELTGAGYVAIGMDHFAKETDDLAIAQREKRLQRNFQGYSTKSGLSILGLGMSSISQTDGSFRQNEKDLDAYKRRIDAGEIPVAKGALLTAEDRRRREIIMQIMCNLELDYTALGKKFGCDFPRAYADEIARLTPLSDDGLLQLSPERLTVLPAGRLFIRNIAMAFDAYLDRTAGRHSKTI